MRRLGLAMPLAVAALLGSLLGRYVDSIPALVALVGILIAVTLWQRRGAWLVCLCALWWCAHGVFLHESGRLPAAAAGSDFRLEGRIEALQREEGRSRFRLSIERCVAFEQKTSSNRESSAEPREESRGGEALSPGCPATRVARLSWYDAPALANGQRWALTARLREPLGFANFDTFDYEAWLWREGVQALGYVRDNEPVRLAPASFSLRREALARLDAVELSPTSGRWLAALTLGAGKRLDDDDWALLNATGTTHLMVISGLHVGLVATLALWLLRTLSRLFQPLAWRMTLWPWIGAGVAAFAYAALAGFEPPAMRAAIMASIGLWAASGRHAPGWWQAWWSALALVVIVDPLSPWRPGVWLSFTAVAVLIVAWAGRPVPRGARGWVYALLRSQWLLAPIMAAAVLLAFGRLAPAAPLVNLIAVPIVSALLVPLGFLGWLAIAWPPLAAILWWPFEQIAEIVTTLLSLSAAAFPLWEPAASQRLALASGFALWGAIWLLPGITGRWRLAASLTVAVALLNLRSPTLDRDTLVVTVHDVGQGQLVEVRTATQRVLVDTGPRFASGFMPIQTLWSPGQTFDAVIVTHGDTDHAGGLPGLLGMHGVGRWWAPGGGELNLPSRECHEGIGWMQGGARWQFLSPPEDSRGLSRNDRSCVLLVTSGERRVLITGDAGVERERQWLDALPGAPIDVLVAGHHGSRSSSSPAFVATTRPRNVVFSSGRGNPYGHPDDTVVERFVALGSQIWNTAFDGAVRFRLTPDDIEIETRRDPGWARRAAVEGSAVGVESRP